MVTGTDFDENGRTVNSYHILSGHFRRLESGLHKEQMLEIYLGWNTDAASGAASHGGRFLSPLYFRGQTAGGTVFPDFFSVKIAFSWGATVIAAVTMSFPLMYRSARGAFEQVNPDLVAAARTLGMGEWTIFRKVLLANAVPGVVSGGVLAFARGLGEFGATAMIAGNIAGKTRTLPMAVYSEVAAGNMDSAFAYVAVIVAIAFLSILVMNAAAWRAGGGIHG